MHIFTQNLYKVGILILALVLANFTVQSQITVTTTWQAEWGINGGPNPAGLDTAALPVPVNRFGSSTIGDLDGDGDQDFISGSYYGTLHYFQNQGTATNPFWASSDTISSLNTIRLGLGIVAGVEVRPDLVDIDSDGDLDLFVGSRWNQAGDSKLDDIHFYRNIGTSTNPIFSKETLPGIQLQQVAEFTSTAFGDLDNDGDLDFVIGGSDSCTYFENIGTSTSPAFQKIYNLFPKDQWVETSFLAPTLDLEDFDNDGDLDLYFMNDGGYLRYIPNNGTATVPNFAPYISHPAHSFDTIDFGKFGSVDFEDLNGDGVKDVITSDFQPAKWYWYSGVPAGPSISFSATSNISCNGLSDGGASTSVSGGTAPYSYLWNNGATTSSITGIIAGTYTVTVTDNIGDTSIDSVTITQPTAVSSSITGYTTGGFNGLLLSCNGYANGGMTVTPTGGSTPYQYEWNNSATTASIVGIVAGTYTVTITDANGCITTDNETITEPVALIAATVVDSNVSCNGTGDGGVSASATGGNTPYTFIWSNGATTASTNYLSAGTYTVTITDANGCTATNSGTVTEPSALIAATVVDSNVSCNGFADGGVTSYATGGSGVYSYNWSNSATTASITGIIAGTYSVTITDANGCTSISSATVTEPAVIAAPTFTGLGTDYCEDAAVVTLSGLPTGGVFTGNGITGNNFDPSTANSGSNDIKYSITDANGCQSFIINATLINTLPTIAISGLAADYCIDAADVTITATPIGGAWTGDVTSTGDFSPATQGTGNKTIYYTFTDANSCVNTDSASTIVNTLPIITLTALADVCADANNAIISGASPAGGDWSGNGVSSNYFSATNAGIGSHYLVYTYTDANACVNIDSTIQLVNSLPVLNITGLDAAYCADADNDTLMGSPSGGSFFAIGMTNNVFDPSVPNYGSVSIIYMFTDAVTGCFNTETATTMVNAIPMVDLGSDNTVCEYNTSTLDAGNAGAFFLWNTGATTQTIVLDTNGNGITNVNYSVVITDANMCSNFDSIEITYEATPISQLTDTNTICGENADITLDAGYVSGNTYVWSNGISWSSIIINSTDLGGNTGNMSVEITSEAGCVYNDTTYVYFREIPVVDLGGDQIVCINHEFTIDAGAGFNSYLWNTGATTQAITIDNNTFNIGNNLLKVEVNNDVNCSAMDSMILVVDPCTGIENNDIANKVNLYPNPNNGEFTIDISTINEDVNIEILSSYGQVIYKANHKATQNRLIEIKQNHLAKGMYYIRISNDNMNLYKKVNIQ